MGAFLRRRIGPGIYLIDELKTAEALVSSCEGHATTWRSVDTKRRAGRRTAPGEQSDPALRILDPAWVFLQRGRELFPCL
jgi:hypothetical protein